MGRGRALLLAVALAACAAASGASAQTAPADSSAQAWERRVEGESSWFWRTVYRYFGRAPRSGEALDGRARSLTERFEAFAGRTIEVVIVQPVLLFDETAADSVSPGLLQRMTAPLRSYTRESIVRQYLLFTRGDALDPYRLADSERLIRQLEYMNDARILVLPIGGGDTVAVVVETRDRFPLGLTGTIHTRDRYDGSVFMTNTFGVGLRLDAEIIVNRQADPVTGYALSAAKRNLGGTFIDLRGDYEDSWRELRRRVGFERPTVHPDIRVIGGAQWQHVFVRDDGGLPEGREQYELWLGRVYRIGDARRRGAPAEAGRRRTLTPAVSFADVDFHVRPHVAADTMRAFHDRHLYLGSLTYRSLADYKTSYLFRMGETEDVSDGHVVRLTGGYEDGEFLKRGLGFVEYDVLRAAASGGITWLKLGGGGFVRGGRFEDGLVIGRLGYITPLLGQESWRQRWYLRLELTQGIRRTTSDGLDLSRGIGIHDLPRGRVRGDKRLVGNAEWRVFTPWRLLGFDCMLLAYGDVGAIGGQDDVLVTRKIYGAAGVGVRLANPELVIPTLELRCGFTRAIDERGFFVSIDAGNASFHEFVMPGARPGVVPYE